MPRPFKRRCVGGSPGSVVYKPAGVRACDLDWVILTLDEFETLRLLDHEGMNQAAAAEKMGVSRPTITRIYASARKKIADAIVLGQAIKIEGGVVSESDAGNEMMTRGRRGRRRYGRGNTNGS